MKVILDGLMIHTKADLHDAFAQALQLPEWYGRNLDALHDCLTDIHEQTQIVLCNYPQLEQTLGPYAHRLQTMLRHAEQTNSFIRILFDQKQEAPTVKNNFKFIIHNNGDVSKKAPEKATQMFRMEYGRDARKFHRQIPGYEMTPLVALPNLAHLLGLGGIYVKNEAMRLHMNSFKVMGGSYAIYRLVKQLLGKENEDLSFEYMVSDECHKALGDLTFCSATDGNHGRGLAWACQKLNYPCKIYVHSETSQPRIDAIRKFGAEVTVVDGNYDDAVRQAAEDAKKNGWYVVSDTSWPGYEEIPTWIMQGYNSIMLETQEQFSAMGIVKPTHVFVQAGVGAMAASVVGFYSALFPEDPPLFIVVEPDKAPCIYESIAAGDGECHSVEGALDTIMAGLACGDPSPVAFDILKNNADIFIQVPDNVAARGMRILGCPLHGDPLVISGESGAVPLGTLFALQTDEIDPELKKVLNLNSDSTVFMINTEGNTDPIEFRRIIWDGKDPVPERYRIDK
ncbi:MAG: diaminopropionate ammonia-lyase [Clostridia bacterium]|nr:diaminopropionate ammonia-lyase [Clostridia bacterium]